jgi:hypothetical protein
MPSIRFLRHTHWRRAKILPYVVDIHLLTATMALV